MATKRSSQHLSHALCTCLTLYATIVYGQQPYSKAPCSSGSGAAINRGYICNGAESSCKAFVAHISQNPYDTVAAIASHYGVDPKTIIHFNPKYTNPDAVVEWEDLLFIPFICLCQPYPKQQQQYYFKPTPYTVVPGDTVSNIANNVFQGLASSEGIRAVNDLDLNPTNLIPGNTIIVPLGCVCPTVNQLAAGVSALIVYPVQVGDTIISISARFKVDPRIIIEANELSEVSVLCAATPLLIPAMVDQSTSQERAGAGTSLSKAEIGLIVGALSILVAVLGVGAYVGFNCCKTVICGNNNRVSGSPKEVQMACSG